jgi:hypothetical protein
MNPKQRYDAKRPLLSFRLPKAEVERFDAWRGSRTRSQAAAHLVSERLRNGDDQDMQPAPGQQFLGCELELVTELGGLTEKLAHDLNVAFKALRGAAVPRGSARYLKGMRDAVTT